MARKKELAPSRAEQLMKEHRFADAARELSERLGQQPDDPQALLELGICHLLNRSEAEFLRIGARAERIIAALESPPARVSRLWSLYRSLAAQVTTAALTLGAVGAMGCDRTTPPADVTAEPTPTVSTAADQPATGAPADDPSGVGGAAEPTAEPSAQDESAAPTATAAATTTQVRPAHRYSGGVRPPPKNPAHRYSGGVLRN